MQRFYKSLKPAIHPVLGLQDLMALYHDEALELVRSNGKVSWSSLLTYLEKVHNVTALNCTMETFLRQLQCDSQQLKCMTLEELDSNFSGSCLKLLQDNQDITWHRLRTILQDTHGVTASDRVFAVSYKYFSAATNRDVLVYVWAFVERYTRRRVWSSDG